MTIRKEGGRSFYFSFSCHTLKFVSEQARKPKVSFRSLNAYGKLNVGLEIQDNGSNWNRYLLSSIFCSGVSLKFLMLEFLKLSDGAQC